MTSGVFKLNVKDLEREIERIALANPSNYHRWTDKEIEMVKKLRAKGVSNRVIAKELGLKRLCVDNLVYHSYYE